MTAEQLRVITETLTQPQPDLPPASLIYGQGIPDDVTAYMAGVERSRPWAMATVMVARRIHEELLKLAAKEPATDSPVVQAEEAKRRRDIVGEVGALMDGHDQLTTAPWYPARPGDLVHVRYDAMGDVPPFGETYAVEASEEYPGELQLRLVHHTAPDPDFAGGCTADGMDDPLADLWMEAGPGVLTIVRDGRVVHAGGAR